jgi:hypothetical protein
MPRSKLRFEEQLFAKSFDRSVVASAEGGSLGGRRSRGGHYGAIAAVEAVAVESVSMEAAAVKTIAVDVDVAKPPHRTQEAIAKNAVGVEADAIKSAYANADATAATVVDAS